VKDELPLTENSEYDTVWRGRSKALSDLQKGRDKLLEFLESRLEEPLVSAKTRNDAAQFDSSTLNFNFILLL